MARAKTKALGTNLPVPQSDAEAEQLIAQLGALQRDLVETQARHDAQVALLEGEHGKAVKASQDAQVAIIDGLSIWASANRERLTGGGRTKTVQLASGAILWREGRFAVKHRGLKIEDIVQAIEVRIAENVDAAALARKEKRQADAKAILEQQTILLGFLRRKVEMNKEAMLAARELAETIPGVTIPRGPEEFGVEPLASQIREVA